MNYKTLFILSIAILLTGCYNSQDTLPLPKKYQQKRAIIEPTETKKHNSTIFYKPASSPKEIVKKVVDLKGDGYIKGVVENLYYDKKKKRWIYSIRGLDISNGKLNFAKVYSLKRTAKIQDLVYAIIKNGYIKSIYIFKSSKSYTLKKKKKIAIKTKHKNKPKKNSSKTSNIRHRKQLLPPPKTETLIF